MIIPLRIHACVIINLIVNNDTTQNKGSLQRDDSPATVEGQSKNPLGDPYLIVSPCKCKFTCDKKYSQPQT